MGKDKLNILLVSPDLKLMGGVAETVKLLLRELDGKADVFSAVFGRRVNQSSLLGFVMPFFDLFAFAKLLFLNKFDVIHINPSLNFRSVVKELLLCIVFMAFGYSHKILIFFHGWEDDFLEKIASNRLYSAIFGFVLNRAGVILVLAGRFKKSLVGIGVDESKIETITTMVDMNDIPIEKSTESHCTTLLYLSRMIVEKGVYETVEAFKIINQEYPDLELIMAGDGPEKNNLMRFADDNALSNIHFPGYIQKDEKKHALEKSCIFLLPTSYGEGCPVALLEAMASGMVSIVADAGGIVDVIEPGKNALLLSDISTESVVTALRHILDDKEHMEDISKCAKEYAAEHFSSNKVTELIYDFYVQIS